MLDSLIGFVRGKVKSPLHKVQVSEYELMRDFYLKRGWEWQDVTIFGIRNELAPEKDEFNDRICLAVNGTVYQYKGTTDPSVYFTKGGTKKEFGGPGAGHVCYGFHKAVYGIGKHMGYKALVQKGKLHIWRDANENFKDDDNQNKTDYFAMNIHHGGNSKKIGRWSAGCQVIQSTTDFAEFLKMAESFCLKGKTEVLLNYAILTEEESPI